jgi:isoquinoline 1-oxidoreductase beta subunit
MDRVSRREVLLKSAAAGGGLLLGWRFETRPRGAAAAATAPSEFAPNAFIRIRTDGRITMIIGQVEMGQGVYTALPMLLAE